jgi:superfamily II DNA or RNA helicase
MVGPDATDGTLAGRIEELEMENARLRSLLGLDCPERVGPVQAPRQTLFAQAPSRVDPTVTQGSTTKEKVHLFRSLFRGRDDVYAQRWEQASTGKKGWSPAVRGGWRKGVAFPDLLPFTDEVMSRHLAGETTAGLYPLMTDDTCLLLACDFDGPGSLLDALAYLDAARAEGIPATLERSRSGDGSHVWILFDDRVAASSARRIGAHLIRQAMAARAELDLASYDRLFPAQDFLPRKGFGNLIALPLQGECRREGTTVFLDPTTLEPYEDQWAFLASVERLSSTVALELAESFGDVRVGPDARSSRRTAHPVPAPSVIHARSASMLEIDRIGLPPELLAQLKHVSSLHNPAFYEKERGRRWTGNTPRFIRCYQETIDQILLPRGLRKQAEGIAVAASSRLDVSDAHPETADLDVEVSVELRDDQKLAVEKLEDHENGVVVGPPGSGKTVVACALIARHRVPTLVVVDRQPLVEQWRERLSSHLRLDKAQIGVLASQGMSSGVVDIAMAQSLARREDLADATARYGFVVIDECHHVPAVTFERAVRQIPAARWLGLTATPYRRDGLQAMMAMYCGPVRHRMPEMRESLLLRRELLVHETQHETEEDLHIQEVFRGVVSDQARTVAICNDIVSSAVEGRNCLVLTRWTEHLEAIVEELRSGDLAPLVLRGGMGKKARRDVVDQLSVPDLKGAILVATSSYLGEGFDCPALDTVFLAFPIRFKGSIVQFVGRILRPVPGKTRVVVHDYVDAAVPVLARMFDERAIGYKSLGFDPPRRPRRSPATH